MQQLETYDDGTTQSEQLLDSSCGVGWQKRSHASTSLSLTTRARKPCLNSAGLLTSACH